MSAPPDSTKTEVESTSSSALTVTQLNRLVRGTLEGRYSGIWVIGEISDLTRPGSGHLYFSLKDEQATVRCAMFRGMQRNMSFRPENGLKVEIFGNVSLYEPRGSYQLIVSVMKPYGIGAIHILFEKTKKRLHAEGLFDERHKKEIPDFPKTIGVVTSATGAAIRDILIVLRRRFPLAQVIVYPTLVQGDNAAAMIVDTLETAGRRAECDVLILSRGGGSIEDMWPFNEEIVARAIHACPLPVVSGVGHEVDTTISDLVADRRAPTPSAAAELVSPDCEDLHRRIRDQERRLIDSLRLRLERNIRHYQQLRRRIRDPAGTLNTLHQRIDENVARLWRAGMQRMANSRREWEHLRHRLQLRYPRMEWRRRYLAELHRRLTHVAGRQPARYRNTLKHLDRAMKALDPHSVLTRGYAIVRQSDGTVVRSCRQLTLNEKLKLTLSEGEASVTTDDIKETHR